MKTWMLLFLLIALSACGAIPPQPPDCEGEYVPINVSGAVSPARD